MTVLITLTTAGSSTGPFNLYSDLDGFSVPFETGVSKAALVAGYTSTLVPYGTSYIRVVSFGTCNVQTDILIGDNPSTTTTTSTSTSTTSTTSTSTTSTSTTSTTSTTSSTTTSTTTTAISYTYYVAQRCDNPLLEQYFRTSSSFAIGTAVSYGGYCWEIQAVQGIFGVDPDAAYIDCPTCQTTTTTTTSSSTTTTTTTSLPCECHDGTINDNNAFSYYDCNGNLQAGGAESGSTICYDINKSYSGNITDNGPSGLCSCAPL